MSGEFNLDYGERVQIKIMGYGGELYKAEPADDDKADILIPYIANALEFGVHMMHPLDYESSQYPKNIEDLDLSKDTQLSGIKLFKKTDEEGSTLLDGI